jgi:hypothetical protein
MTVTEHLTASDLEDPAVARALAVRLTDAIAVAKVVNAQDIIDPDTGRRLQVTTTNAYAIAELHGIDVGHEEPDVFAIRVSSGPPKAPRSQPVYKPPAERIVDDGTVTCPVCSKPEPINHYPTTKDQQRDFRACRACIRQRRADRKAAGK